MSALLAEACKREPASPSAVMPQTKRDLLVCQNRQLTCGMQTLVMGVHSTLLARSLTALSADLRSVRPGGAEQLAPEPHLRSVSVPQQAGELRLPGSAAQAHSSHAGGFAGLLNPHRLSFFSPVPYQVPVGDLEEPLAAALDVPSVRRFMVFNSALFHFILAPVILLSPDL